MSEHIKVISVIDRFLEHSRIYYFANGGNEELYLSSADCMPRNLDKRVEIMFPVLQDDTKSTILDILKSYFSDNTHAWRLDSNGSWSRVESEGDEPYRVQARFLVAAEEAAASAAGISAGSNNAGFIIRRSPPPQS